MAPGAESGIDATAEQLDRVLADVEQENSTSLNAAVTATISADQSTVLPATAITAPEIAGPPLAPAEAAPADAAAPIAPASPADQPAAPPAITPADSDAVAVSGRTTQGKSKPFDVHTAGQQAGTKEEQPEAGAKAFDPDMAVQQRSAPPATHGENTDSAKRPAQPGQPSPHQLPQSKPETQLEHLFASEEPNAATKTAAAETSVQVVPSLPHAASASANTLQAAPVSAAQPVPVNALAVEIAGQARAGNSRFEIRLDPPELGRIDVRLDVDRDGNVTSRLVIERADTYDLLRRDQSTLERALQQAGLKTSDNALEFSLRDQGFAQQRHDDNSRPGRPVMIAEQEIMPAEAANGYSRLIGARGAIDIRV